MSEQIVNHVRMGAVGLYMMMNHPRMSQAKNIVFALVVYRLVRRIYHTLRYHGIMLFVRQTKKKFFAKLFRALKIIPAIRRKIDGEMGKVLADVEEEVAPKKEGVPRYLALQRQGMSAEEVGSAVQRYAEMGTVDYHDGKLSGCVYHGGDAITDIIFDAMKTFSWSNPLHPDVFPGTRKMEAECVSMVVNMYNGDDNACGTMTSGGTESILMATKAYRDLARERGIKEPEMIVPVSAHAAFNKAAEYFGVMLVPVPVNEISRKACIKSVRRAINSNTCMLVGSAPSFPHGVVDDIQKLSSLGKKYNVPLHVDCCLGGFVVPFMNKAGYELSPFDFRLPGVTSISCDTHKYGFAPKGSSVIMYRTRSLRHHQYFVCEDWTGGIYASPGVAGSRAGNVIAGCWAAMMHTGEEGYVNAVKQIIGVQRRLRSEVAKIPGLFIYGEPNVSVLAFGSKIFNIYQLSTDMGKRGWNLNNLQHPISVHLCVTYLTTEKVADSFLSDMSEIAAELMKNPTAPAEGSAAVYGLAQAIPDRTMVDRIAKGFIDSLYSA